MPVADVSKRIKYYVTNRVSNTVSVVDGLSNQVTKVITVGSTPVDIIATTDKTIYVANDTADTISVLCDEEVIKTLKIPNSGTFDIDEGAGRLYAATGSLFAGTSVTINDLATGQLISTIGGLVDVEFIKLDHSKKRLFVLDGTQNNVKIFNAFSPNTLIATIPVQNRPIFITISDDDTRAYVSNANSTSISVLDIVNNTAIFTIPLGVQGPFPFGSVINGNILYVTNNVASNLITKINLDLNMVVGTITVPGIDLSRIVVTPDKRKLVVNNFQTSSISVIDIGTENVTTIASPTFNGAFGVLALSVGSPISPGDPIDLTDPYQLDDIKESVCIITKKVFSSCQQRECFPNVEVPITECCEDVSFEKITFGNGFIVSGTETRTPIKGRPNFSRVKFILRVPFAIHYLCDCKEKIIKGFLSDIYKDVVLFIPETRDEFKLNIVVETRSELLPLGSKPSIIDDNFVFTVGIFVVIKVVGKVQLLIPAFGYCPEPPDCEDFIEPFPPDLCEIFKDFDRTPFPEDFFPPQFEDLQCKI